MFANASTFTYPTDAADDFAKALTSADGGAYFVRGGGTGGADAAGRSAPVIGTTSAPAVKRWEPLGHRAILRQLDDHARW